MSTPNRIARVAGIAAVLALVPGVAALADDERRDDQPRLVGRAVLPVETYAGPPPAGAFFAGQTINGITFPLPGQPVAGFSAIVEGREPGEWLAMPDNGFGTKANSRDFLIRAYWIRPDFKTVAGGSGDVEVGQHISFRDPNGVIGFPIVNEGTADRLLTGADIDPESLQVGKRGELWVGEEFGPWILHFDATGVLLEEPIPLPGNLMSPNNPFLSAPAQATQPNSRGLEGMGISANGRYLYPTLEGATVADLAADPDRRLMWEYDTRAGSFTNREWVYRVDHVDPPAQMFVADVAPLDQHRLVVIERDAAAAVNRHVYVVDLRKVGADGSLIKREVLDLASIPDPDLVSLPEIHPGDIGIGETFSVVCESVEAVRVLRGNQLLVGCDNNFPNKARNPNLADDNEFIVVDVPALKR